MKTQLVLRTAVAAFACFSLLASSASAQRISESGMADIAAILQEKEKRTPAQAKIATHYLYKIKEDRGERILPDGRLLSTDVQVDSKGMVKVDILGDVTPHLLATIRSLGGEVVLSRGRERLVRARLQLADLETIAGMSEVQTITRPKIMVSRQIISEGDAAHRADVARANLSITGAGVRIGVVADGVDNITTVPPSELPTVTIKPACRAWPRR